MALRTVRWLLGVSSSLLSCTTSFWLDTGRADGLVGMVERECLLESAVGLRAPRACPGVSMRMWAPLTITVLRQACHGAGQETILHLSHESRHPEWADDLGRIWRRAW